MPLRAGSGALTTPWGRVRVLAGPDTVRNAGLPQTIRRKILKKAPAEKNSGEK
jgi:hypothetical protein